MWPTIRFHYVVLITLAVGLLVGFILTQAFNSTSVGIVGGALGSILDMAFILFLDNRERAEQLPQE